MKKVSIIIPVYNCEQYLDECFESVENQTFPISDLEIIIVNDGSTDNSLIYIEKYIKKHQDWILINQKNSGLSESRNNALNIAKGEFVFFLDSDDFLPSNAIEILYNKIKDGYDLIIGGMKNYNSSGILPNYTEKFLRKDDNINYKTNLNLLEFVHAQAKLYRKDCINNLRFIKGVKHEDNYFTLSLYIKELRIGMIEDIVYFHRVREGNSKSIMQSLNIQSFRDLIVNYLSIIEQNKMDYKLCRYFIKKTEKYRVRFLNSKEYRLSKKESKKLFTKIIKNANIDKFDKLRLYAFHLVLIVKLKIYYILKHIKLS